MGPEVEVSRMRDYEGGAAFLRRSLLLYEMRACRGVGDAGRGRGKDWEK
jgi:hypothetical protein